jgi:hypothetical protein
VRGKLISLGCILLAPVSARADLCRDVFRTVDSLPTISAFADQHGEAVTPPTQAPLRLDWPRNDHGLPASALQSTPRSHGYGNEAAGLKVYVPAAPHSDVLCVSGVLTLGAFQLLRRIHLVRWHWAGWCQPSADLVDDWCALCLPDFFPLPSCQGPDNVLPAYAAPSPLYREIEVLPLRRQRLYLTQIIARAPPTGIMHLS